MGLIFGPARCSVQFYFGHYGDPGLPGEHPPLEECQWVGYWTCYGDDYNESVPPENTIPVDPIPEGWPPKNDDDTYDYDGLAQGLSDTWCSILKSLDKCCEQKSKKKKGKKSGSGSHYGYGGEGSEESERGCNCHKCQLNVQFTNGRSPGNKSGLDDFTYNIRLIRSRATNLDGLQDGCADLDADLKSKYWGNGLPRRLSPPAQWNNCKK